MKDLVQCRKLEAKFRQLAVSDPARRFLWLAEAENGNARPKRKSLLTSKHAMPCDLPVQPMPQNRSLRSRDRSFALGRKRVGFAC